MATWDELSQLTLSLPEVTETTGRGLRQWRVGKKLIVWERPLRASDFEALGDDAPEGPIIGVRLPDLMAKEALLADGGDAYFATPHFDGYRAILVQLDLIPVAELEELVVEAWVDRAPKRLVRQWEAEQGDD